MDITAVYCYTVTAPNTIGVNQQVKIVFWSNELPPTAVGAFGDRWTFTVDVTGPEGTHETLPPVTSDPVGAGFTTYTPTKIGNYTFTTTVAQHTITGGDPNGFPPNWGPFSSGYSSVGDVYAAATSIPATLIVQEEPILNYPAAVLPTNYWSRPINAQNREWWTISGDWYDSRGYNAAAAGYYYKGGGYNPYTTGPASAHVVWAQPMPTFGGLMGGSLSEAGGIGNYYTGMSYEQMWGTGPGPFIIDGRLYYNTPQFAKPSYGVYCVDLRTGQQYWYQNYTVTNGQVYNYVSPNQFGGIPYLWNIGRSTYDLYDAVTGNWILSFVNPLTGTVAYSPTDGSLLVLHVFLNGMDGYIHCLDIYTGKWLWDFSTGSSGLETDWGNWPLLTATFLGGAPGTGGLRIYSVGGHTHLQPLYRGARMYCVNGSNGALLWSISGWFEAGAPAGADGYMAAINGYDNQLYCFGKGNTQTTVDAPMTGITFGNTVVIRGTVTDQSPGQTCLGKPAAGTPAISDDSMSTWMEYLYMEQPMPKNATGVEVTLETLDPNGNFYEIANTTSDASGMYSYVFTPEVPGLYTIIATFEGSNSYYSSYAETAINVVEAPQASPTPTPPPPSMADTYIIGFGTAIIIIMIVGFVILILRKR